ncbi:MAG: hypothetical protein JWN48_815 [Myxococcaceae bacterium]|nr:hypothetical protein [Myxococcaceae bacterium]
MHQLAILLVLLCCGLAPACVSSYPIPMAQAPLFTKAGEAEVGVGARPFAPRRGLVAFTRVAATDHVRLGALVNGSALGHSRDWGTFDGPFYVRRALALYGEGFAGYEGSHRMLRYGALLGAGYGESTRTFKRCLRRDPVERDEGFGPAGCIEARTDKRDARYLRTYGQLHVGVAPPGLWRGAVGIRVPYVHEFELGRDDPRVLPEGFVTQSLTFARVRLEFQVLAGPVQRVSFGLAMMLRFGPGSRERRHQESL